MQSLFELTVDIGLRSGYKSKSKMNPYAKFVSIFKTLVNI